MQYQLSQCPGVHISHLSHAPLHNVNFESDYVRYFDRAGPTLDSESGIINFNNRQFSYEILTAREREERSRNISIVSFMSI